VKDPQSAERDPSQVGETVAGTAETLLTVENTPLALSLMSPDGRIVIANRALRLLLGHTYDELVGRSVFAIVAAHPTDSERKWRARLANSEKVTPERRVHLRSGDGSVLPVRAASVLVTDADGEVCYVIVRFTPEPA
jgi:PAS domain S-box-containing protein